LREGMLGPPRISPILVRHAERWPESAPPVLAHGWARWLCAAPRSRGDPSRRSPCGPATLRRRPLMRSSLRPRHPERRRRRPRHRSQRVPPEQGSSLRLCRAVSGLLQNRTVRGTRRSANATRCPSFHAVLARGQEIAVSGGRGVFEPCPPLRIGSTRSRNHGPSGIDAEDRADRRELASPSRGVRGCSGCFLIRAARWAIGERWELYHRAPMSHNLPLRARRDPDVELAPGHPSKPPSLELRNCDPASSPPLNPDPDPRFFAGSAGAAPAGPAVAAENYPTATSKVRLHPSIPPGFPCHRRARPPHESELPIKDGKPRRVDREAASLALALVRRAPLRSRPANLSPRAPGAFLLAHPPVPGGISTPRTLKGSASASSPEAAPGRDPRARRLPGPDSFTGSRLSRILSTRRALVSPTKDSLTCRRARGFANTNTPFLRRAATANIGFFSGPVLRVRLASSNEVAPIQPFES